MKTSTLRYPAFALLLLLAALMATPSVRADFPPTIGRVEEVGDGTFSVTCTGATKFSRNTKNLKALATAEAEKYCQTLGKQLEVVSVTENKSIYVVGGFPSVKLVFKPVDPAASPAPASATTGSAKADDDFYALLIKLDDLHKRGILTDEEFQAEKKKALAKIK